MDPSMIVRAARRKTGLSQRAFARRAGISSSSLEDAESGRAQPGWRTVERAVSAAGLSLCLAPEVEPASAELRRFLGLSTGDRAWLALHRRPLQDGMRAVCRTGGQVHLPGPGSVPVWVPGVLAPDPLVVHLHRPRRALPEVPAQIEVIVLDGPLPSPLVSLRLWGTGLLHVDDPTALSVRRDCAEHAPALRDAAHCLHTARAVDEAGRRAPAHRDPREDAERQRLFHDKTLKQKALPDAEDSRAWRLGGEVSLAQWLARGRPIRQR